MAKAPFSTKRLQIDKANSAVVIAAGVGAFILIFCAIASKTLVVQAAYQNRIISAKKVAVNQLKQDITATSSLKSAYTTFDNAPQNVIGGSSSGSGGQDGSNAKIVLDALPSAYDFPALATSLDRLLSSQGLTVGSIAGTDDALAQAKNATSSTPQPIPMPFQISVTGNYGAIQNLVNLFEHSIRPIQIQTLSLAGDQTSLTLSITAQTFYQPAKSLNISTKVVK